MKHIAFLALLTFGVAGLYANDKPVKMTFSGTAAASSVDLKIPDTRTSEYQFAGKSTLGSFTFRNIYASRTIPEPSNTCSGPTQFYFTVVAGGAAVFRFQDGSLLNATLTDGADCIDFAALQAHCTRTFQITGGTGPFKDVSGTLSFSETVVPVLADASQNPVFFAATGDATGSISGVAREEGEQQDDRQ